MMVVDQLQVDKDTKCCTVQLACLASLAALHEGMLTASTGT
jgi:hypothetical protein